MSKDITVYWSPWIEGEYTTKQTRQGVNQWVYEEPQSVYKDLLQHKSSEKITKSFYQCPATRDALTNVYMIKSPYRTEARVLLKEDGSVDKVEQNWDPIYPSQCIVQIAHAPSKKNELLVVLEYSYLFYCDESLQMRMTAPWFHNAPHLRYGAPVPGVFDIGRWIRPVNCEINLWEGVTDLIIEEDEPVAYLEFGTDKKIVFQRFESTQKIKEIIADAITTRSKKTVNSLAKRYEIFDRSPVKKIMVKEIKDNLL